MQVIISPDKNLVASETVQRGTNIRIIFITGQAHDVGPLEKVLESLGYSTEVKQVASFDGFRESLKTYSPDIVLVELNLPGFDGVQALDFLRSQRPDIPLLVISDQGDNPVDMAGMNDVERLAEYVVQGLQNGKGMLSNDKAEAESISAPELDSIFRDMESAPAGLALIDPLSMKPLYVNEVFADMTGYSAAELVAMKSVLKLVVPDDIAAVDDFLRMASRTKPASEGSIVRIIRKNGLIAQMFIAAKQYDWTDRKRIAMIAHYTTGPRKNSGERIAEENDDMVANPIGVADIAVGFAVFDVDGKGRVRSWNSGAEQFTGYPGSEVLGTDFGSLILSDEKFREDTLSFLGGSDSVERVELESYVSRKDGAKFRAGVTLTRLFDAVGMPAGFSAFLRRLPAEGVPDENPREREAQLHSLASHLQKAREEEKSFIARQLHDEFGQTLTALRMDLSILGRMIARTVSEPLGRGSLLEKISSVSEILEKAIRSARDMITELRPAVLDELGLLTAIQWQVLEFENRTGINCHITKLQHGETFDQTVSTTTFRILQEALDNVKRHSAATDAYISLQVIGPNLVLEVTDNGIGIEADKLKSPTSIGIIGMRERVLALGGNLDVRGEPGRGTAVTVSIPRATHDTSRKDSL